MVLLQVNLLAVHPALLVKGRVVLIPAVRPAAVLLINTVLQLQNVLILDAVTTLLLQEIRTVVRRTQISVLNVKNTLMRMLCIV